MKERMTISSTYLPVTEIEVEEGDEVLPFVQEDGSMALAFIKPGRFSYQIRFPKGTAERLAEKIFELLD